MGDSLLFTLLLPNRRRLLARAQAVLALQGGGAGQAGSGVLASNPPFRLCLQLCSRVLSLELRLGALVSFGLDPSRHERRAVFVAVELQ